MAQGNEVVDAGMEQETGGEKIVGQIDTSDPVALENERWAWWFSDFSKGPDTILMNLWVPAVLALAAADSICGSASGHSSGADGQICSADASWNQTLWDLVNGSSHCSELLAFGTIRYTHDPSLPGCSEALQAYRANTTYTCNRTGDYSYLAGLANTRVGNMVAFQASFNQVVSTLVMPAFGAYIDFVDNRRTYWIVIWLTAVVSTCLMGILSPNYGWLGGFAFASVTHITTDALFIPIVSYLPDVADTDEMRGKLGGYKQMASFGAQILFIAFMFIFIQMYGTITAGIIASVTAGLFLLIFMPFSLQYMRSRPARKKREGRSFCDITFMEVFRGCRRIFCDHPEVLKYLVAQSLAQNGIVTVIAVNATYFSIQMKLSGAQILIISGVTLLMGVPCGYLFSVASQRFSLKRLWQFLLTWWIMSGIITPIVLHREGDLIGAIIVGGGMYGFGLVWYFSIGFQAYDSLVPANEIGLFAGAFSFFTSISGFLGPTIYGAIVQATNNQQMAIFSLVPYNFIALIIFSFVDFEKGAREAGRV